MCVGGDGGEAESRMLLHLCHDLAEVLAVLC